MVYSGTVLAEDTYTFDVHNNLRDDILNPTGGHKHAGTVDSGAQLGDFQSFLSSGSWVKPAGIRTVIVRCIGGGGGGGGGMFSTGSGAKPGGGGGGGGACSERVFRESYRGEDGRYL